MTIRIGFGYDVHALVPARQLVLGGIALPFERGLAGHSDGDALTHAVVDALLGAAALGDIGTYFPSHDVRWAEQPGSVFLTAVLEMLCEHKQWRIGNIDATIVAERPKMAPYLPQMRCYLAEHLHLAVEQVSVKATTTDTLGFAGREEGIACYAIVVLEQMPVKRAESPMHLSF
jgi:2-C-methyl-D-erythritol 2,4-cyclodiphosphate synthase